MTYLSSDPKLWALLTIPSSVEGDSLADTVEAVDPLPPLVRPLVGRERSEPGRRQGAISSLPPSVSGCGGANPGADSLPDSSVTSRPGESGTLCLPEEFFKYVN